jgi:hypothetical protein
MDYKLFLLFDITFLGDARLSEFQRENTVLVSNIGRRLLFIGYCLAEYAENNHKLLLICLLKKKTY